MLNPCRILVFENEDEAAIKVFKTLCRIIQGGGSSVDVTLLDDNLEFWNIDVCKNGSINSFLKNRKGSPIEKWQSLKPYNLVLLDLQIPKQARWPQTKPSLDDIFKNCTLEAAFQANYFGACVGEWLLKNDFEGKIFIHSQYVDGVNEEVQKWVNHLCNTYPNKVAFWSKKNTEGLSNHIQTQIRVDHDTNIISTIQFCASTDEPVLILGETGTEKGRVAAAIHTEWEKKHGASKRPFMKVNCGAFSEEHLRAELFGYVKGGISGASYHSFGKALRAAGLEMSSNRLPFGATPQVEFLNLMKKSAKDKNCDVDDSNSPEISVDNREIAGTLFLDEVGELPITLQKKLLSFLSSKPQVEPIGLESYTMELQRLRIIAATSNPRWLRMADMESREDVVDYDTVRRDIYYRLARHIIRMRPLKSEDVIPMIARILANPKESPEEAQVISSGGILTDREKVALFWEFEDKEKGIDGAVEYLIECVSKGEVRGNMRQLRTIIRLANHLRKVSAKIGRGSQQKVTKKMVGEIFQPPPRSDDETATESIVNHPNILATLDSLFEVIFPTGETSRSKAALFTYLAYVIAGNKEDGERALKAYEQMKKTGLNITQSSLPGLNYWRTRGKRLQQTLEQKEAFEFVVDFIDFVTGKKKPDIRRSFGQKRESIGDALHLVEDVKWKTLVQKLEEYLKRESKK